MVKISTSCNSSKSSTEKKFKLFGVLLDQSVEVFKIHQETGTNKGFLVADHDASSATTSTTLTTTEKGKKFECQYCLKVFANSQALGGHQNAHKKERSRKRRLQLQARKTNIISYIQPFYSSNDHLTNKNPYNTYNGSNNLTWFYDPSCHAPQFSLYEESQISFSHDHDQMNGHHDVSRWNASLPGYFPLQQDRRFKATGNKILPDSKKTCSRKNFGLKLGLSLNSVI